jgi:hypothetical protein
VLRCFGYYVKSLLGYRDGLPGSRPDVLDYLHRIGHTPVENQLAGTYARSILKRLLIDTGFGLLVS